ncbi:MAG: glycosyltransferase family 4 protein [Gemmataceae bacterium]
MPGEPLKFCLVTTFYPPYHFGGDGVFVYRLAEALAQRGHRVDVVHSADAYRALHPADPEVAFDQHPNVRRHVLESPRRTLPLLAAHQLGSPALYGRRLRTILNGGGYDVIHYHNVSLLGGPGVLRYGRAVKLYTAHEYWLVCPTHVLFAFDREACDRRRCVRCTLHARRPVQWWRYTGLLHRCLRHVDQLLMPSRFALERHRADGLDMPMAVLPHFVPPPRAAADCPARPRPFFLCVGRLEKLKGVQDLIALFRDYRAADLVIAGSGGYAAELRQMANGLPHVQFLGAVHPDILSGLYRQAIALLAPSLCYETFGLTVAESLAHGTPAVVRRIGALTELIDESGAGFTYATPDECRDALERLQTVPGLRDELGRRGRLFADASWTCDVHLNCYLDVIAGIQSEHVTRMTGRDPLPQHGGNDGPNR